MERRQWLLHWFVYNITGQIGIHFLPVYKVSTNRGTNKVNIYPSYSNTNNNKTNNNNNNCMYACDDCTYSVLSEENI